MGGMQNPIYRDQKNSCKNNSTGNAQRIGIDRRKKRLMADQAVKNTYKIGNQ